MKLINEKLNDYIKDIIDNSITIPNERKILLKKLVSYIRRRITKGNIVNLVFICTHNSRRSHFAQIWATLATNYYNLNDLVKCYSGGTEETSFNLNALKAIENSGFKILKADKPENPNNPIYKIIFSDEAEEIISFSKVYFDPFNPKTDFIAVMTCSEADDNCPFVPGAENRFAITYEDPKNYDGTEEQEQKYAETCKHIATEMFWLFEKI